MNFEHFKNQEQQNKNKNMIVIHIFKFSLRNSGDKLSDQQTFLTYRANSILLKTFPKSTVFAPIVSLKKKSHNDQHILG